MKYKKGERVLLTTNELFWCRENHLRSDTWIFDGTIARIIDVVDKYYYLLYHDDSTGAVQDVFIDGTQYYADS